MSNFYLRTESIKQDEILDLSVTNETDEMIISSLISSEPCLLEGSRGTGKSFLMKVAEIKINNEHKDFLAAFVSFNISSLINTNDPLQFYHWMLAKTLKSLLNKLRSSGIVISNYSANLLSNDTSENNDRVERSLREIVKDFESSYKGNPNVTIESLPDIEDVKEAIENICKENSLQRIYFFFDEAAHVFRPDQQRQFFSLFKDLRSPYITCNAAIYPGVTHFGESFEKIHDSNFIKLERNIKDNDYLQYFEEIILKQADESLKKEIASNKENFNILALACGGNPRMLIRTIQDLPKLKTAAINSLVKDFYRSKIWSEHTDLGDKYKGHKEIIDWGRDFLEKQVIPSLEKYNSTRKEKQMGESSIYFWIHKDSPEAVMEALRLLTYSGIIRKIDSSIRATRSELGDRYEVKFGCIIALQSNPSSEAWDFYKSLSLKKFPEFGKNYSFYSSLAEVNSDIIQKGNYSETLQHLLQKPISVLQLLTPWQKSKLEEVGIKTIENLHIKTEADLIQKIYNVGPVRARIMKNAANAELLEYLSG